MAFFSQNKLYFILKTKRASQIIFHIYVKTNLASPFSFQLIQISFLNSEKSSLWLENVFFTKTIVTITIRSINYLQINWASWEMVVVNMISRTFSHSLWGILLSQNCYEVVVPFKRKKTNFLGMHVVGTSQGRIFKKKSNEIP